MVAHYVIGEDNRRTILRPPEMVAATKASIEECLV
jgi:hypothetical protein